MEDAAGRGGAGEGWPVGVGGATGVIPRPRFCERTSMVAGTLMVAILVALWRIERRRRRLAEERAALVRRLERLTGGGSGWDE